MKPVVIKKLFDVIKNRPKRLVSRDFCLRLVRTLQSLTIYKKLPQSSSPRLYFDVTVFSIVDNKTGVQRVIRSVLEEIKPLLRDQYEIIPVSCTAVTLGFHALQEVNIDGKKKFKITKYKISPIPGDIFLSLEQAFVEHLAQEKVFEAMKKNGCRIIFTVYDLLPLQLPNCFPPEVNSIFKDWLLLSSNFGEFLCDSKTVERDLKNYLSLYNRNLINSNWFYPGSNFLSNIASSGITEKQHNYLNNQKKFKFNFLMVGTIEPRKGHKIIYDLFTQLWETHNIDLSLTFIGKKGWMIDELTDSFSTSEYLNKNFFWFNQASDEFLKLCYASTDAVIIASLNEGFGLPIIEAAQHGCRIIANDIPVFREVAPPECFFLRLDNFDAATLQFRDWLKKPSPRCSSVKLQTWGESTKQIVTKLKLISSLQTK